MQKDKNDWSHASRRIPRLVISCKVSSLQGKADIAYCYTFQVRNTEIVILSSSLQDTQKVTIQFNGNSYHCFKLFLCFTYVVPLQSDQNPKFCIHFQLSFLPQGKNIILILTVCLSVSQLLKKRLFSINLGVTYVFVTHEILQN